MKTNADIVSYNMNNFRSILLVPMGEAEWECTRRAKPLSTRKHGKLSYQTLMKRFSSINGKPLGLLFHVDLLTTK